ncbi:MAG: imidazole glycerol phosphate synthase subunit HisH [Gammaproteobacteria bacterium]|nr:imidazole glycerol phosphate synthase subunit HisH [Gammaproteobacteria bacterium]MDG1952343.1 imidazole glycerol phosphate synthase subunit HisH [Gammaproteobacteria bacterium]MDG2118501.1 imidazole glycerol phosphate synthase subunit HisH [Gammaproteobacteria bacterium]
MLNKIAIIDYGMGNLHSVAKALDHVGTQKEDHVEISITADPRIIEASDRVVFPGVGAIRDCMAAINRLGIGAIIGDCIAAEKPILAICVGMQSLMTMSDENGGVNCLDIIPGRVKNFSNRLLDEQGKRLKVPHMGWNVVSFDAGHPLWTGIKNRTRFYFVHSYYVPTTEINPGSQVAGQTLYGENFVAAVAKKNIFATQFHPEKSQAAGLLMLKNFLEWDGTVVNTEHL